MPQDAPGQHPLGLRRPRSFRGRLEGRPPARRHPSRRCQPACFETPPRKRAAPAHEPEANLANKFTATAGTQVALRRLPPLLRVKRGAHAGGLGCLPLPRFQPPGWGGFMGAPSRRLRRLRLSARAVLSRLARPQNTYVHGQALRTAPARRAGPRRSPLRRYCLCRAEKARPRRGVSLFAHPRSDEPREVVMKEIA